MPSLRSSSRIQRSPPTLMDSGRSSHSDAAQSDDFKLTGAARRMQVLLETNSLLEKMGFGSRSFEDYDDLVASVSSMGVALYEKLFQFHLENVVRVPQSAEDYVFNAQLVVDALSGALLDESFDTQHVTGASLCDGDVASIQQLVRMFVQIYEILYSENPPAKEEEEEDGGDYADEEEEAGPPDRSSDQRQENAKSKDSSVKTTNRNTVGVQKKKKKESGSRQAAMANSSSSNFSKRSELLATRRPVSKSTSGRGSRQMAMTAAKVNPTTTTTSIATVKKRTRRVDGETIRSRTETREHRVKDNHADAAMERELLTTQRYGRFVPVPQRSTRRRENEPQEAEDNAVFNASVLELHEDELAAGETYFGGVSSVSGASGSSASIHFMEEEGEFAKNFSNIHSHSSPGTESKSSPETNVTLDHPETSTTDVKLPRKSKNQQEAEQEVSPSTSPAKKKHAMAQPTESPTPKRAGVHRDQPQASTTAAATTTTAREAAPSLYPLMPETARHDRGSKAHKEYLRYKIQLKDHLQELRHREFCQRQHLERAFRLGEHTANVERIRARRFEQELRLHRISIGLDAKTQEEKQLRDAMQHMLHLEKEKLRDEHKTTKQMLKAIQHEHAEREQAMENFYATQIQLVKEQTRRELTEREAVEKAHRMASEQMIREMKRERERELGALLTEKQHLAEVRRFRHATQLTHAIEKGTEVSARQGDAFYAAAMKARQLRAMKTTTTSSASTIKKTQQPRRMAATRAVYSTKPTARRTAVRV